MRTLYIDTHLNDLNIILFDNMDIVKEEHVINERNNSSLLMPSIAKVIDNEPFDEILVVNGPGSFTGVRLGVTVAKTLAYTMNKKIKVKRVEVWKRDAIKTIKLYLIGFRSIRYLIPQTTIAKLMLCLNRLYELK